ncbi:hypothetical protein [Leptolyngbya sp. O-77]|nr:hypothetical protein [Leptolyngbya sp. O-77]
MQTSTLLAKSTWRWIATDGDGGRSPLSPFESAADLPLAHLRLAE